MDLTKVQNLACPIDGEVLSFHKKQLVCLNGHTFDIARQGYVNLLPVQHKRSKQPGDSKEMVLARTQFLNSGLYEPIAKKLAEITFSLITHNTTCLLDAGCGEGYYLNFVLNNIMNKSATNNFSYIGLDISKHAIVAASKRTTQITWLVGTNRQPPVTATSVDIVLCVFGFQSFEGFTKIIKSGGHIILIEPGPDHLKELREIIYLDVKKTEPPELSFIEQTGFSLITSEQQQFKTGEINNEVINNLLLMTPHFFRANKQGREAASKLQKLDLTIDVVFRILKKQH